MLLVDFILFFSFSKCVLQSISLTIMSYESRVSRSSGDKEKKVEKIEVEKTICHIKFTMQAVFSTCFLHVQMNPKVKPLRLFLVHESFLLQFIFPVILISAENVNWRLHFLPFQVNNLVRQDIFCWCDFFFFLPHLRQDCIKLSSRTSPLRFWFVFCKKLSKKD